MNVRRRTRRAMCASHLGQCTSAPSDHAYAPSKVSRLGNYPQTLGCTRAATDLGSGRGFRHDRSWRITATRGCACRGGYGKRGGLVWTMRRRRKMTPSRRKGVYLLVAHAHCDAVNDRLAKFVRHYAPQSTFVAQRHDYAPRRQTPWLEL